MAKPLAINSNEWQIISLSAPIVKRLGLFGKNSLKQMAQNSYSIRISICGLNN
jgi:hypothetical protein